MILQRCGFLVFCVCVSEDTFFLEEKSFNHQLQWRFTGRKLNLFISSLKLKNHSSILNSWENPKSSPKVVLIIILKFQKMVSGYFTAINSSRDYSPPTFHRIYNSPRAQFIAHTIHRSCFIVNVKCLNTVS